MRYRLAPEDALGHSGEFGRDLPPAELAYLRMQGVTLRPCYREPTFGVQLLHANPVVFHTAEDDYQAVVNVLVAVFDQEVP